jgi:hypothetical protein
MANHYRRFTSGEVGQVIAAHREAARQRKARLVERDANAERDVTGIPDGYRLVPANVYTDGQELVVCANPWDVWPDYEDCDGDHPHNCDAEGCGWEHAVARCRVEPVPGEPTEKGGGE